MKVKKVIEVAICDFCENDAWKKCPICGKDVCQSHELTLHVHFLAYGEGLTGHPTRQLVRHFCPDHLTEELSNLLVQS